MRTMIKRACPVPLAIIVLLAAAAPPRLGASDGEAGEKTRSYHLNGEFWTSLGKDTAGVLTAPFSWKAPDLLCFGGLVGAWGLAYALDGDIQDWTRARRSEGLDRAMAIFSEMGNAAYQVVFLAGLYAAGEIAPSLGLRRTAVLGLESLAVTSVVVVSLKFLMGRARPETGYGPRHFEPFSFRSSYYSLPSGHAASAFALATSIAQQSDCGLVDAAVYVLAAAVALSRVYNNEHWTSDVLLGAALGHFIARGIAGLNRSTETKAVLLLSVSPGGFGLSLRF